MMPRITLVDLASAKARLIKSHAGYDTRAPYRDAIARLEADQRIELMPEAGVTALQLKRLVGRAAKEVNRQVASDATEHGTLLVWLEDAKRPRSPQRRRRDRAGDEPWPVSGEPVIGDGPSLAAQLQRRAEAYLDLAMRAQADFLAYKRRTTEEFEQKIRDVNLGLLLELLPIVDDFQRAFASVPNDLAEHSWPQGITLISRKLHHVLEQQGLEQIGREGDPFDPHIHEAVAYEEHPVYGEGLIARVSCSGYRLNDRLLRPAQVVVARGEAKSEHQDPGAPAKADEPRRTAAGLALTPNRW